MPTINNDLKPKVFHLSYKVFQTFMLFIIFEGKLTPTQRKQFDITPSTLTTLKYLGLIYKDRDAQTWYVSKYGERFITGGIPCSTKITVFNQETSEESNKQYFSDLFDKYILNK